LISKEQVLVQDVVAGVGEDGEAFTRPEISKHLEAYDKLVKRRADIYQLMMATRFNKKDVVKPTDSLSDILAQAQEKGFKIEEKPKDLSPNDYQEIKE
jgi:hypothetical protein